jgi:Bacterial protein of unknown function (DUF899)
MTDHTIVGPKQWQAAREALLQREKAHTQMGDELARQRRQLPWVAVDKPYRFDTDHGPASLAELFHGRSQLLVYHFMFGPSYQAGDPVNSSIADTRRANRWDVVQDRCEHGGVGDVGGGDGRGQRSPPPTQTRWSLDPACPIDGICADMVPRVWRARSWCPRSSATSPARPARPADPGPPGGADRTRRPWSIRSAGATP